MTTIHRYAAAIAAFVRMQFRAAPLQARLFESSLLAVGCCLAGAEIVWAIDDARLPEDGTVVNQLRLWEVHPQTILVAGAVVLGQFLLIGGLLVQRRRRRQSEGRNRAILRAMPDLMFVQSMNGVYLDYHVANPSQLLLKPEQFLGRNMRDVLPPDLLRAIEPAFAQAAVATEPVVVRYDLPMPDGLRRYEARLLRNDNRILTLVRDVTERQQAEDALSESQERYALATAAGSVGVWDWNFETDELFVDSRLKAMLGYEDHEISNRPDDWGSRVHPDDVAAAAAAIQACVDRASDSYEVEHRMLHKDGSVKWLLSRGTAIRAADGTVRRLVGTKVDITNRKRIDMMIRENEAALQASNREIQDLAGRLIASQEVERARIARDLHDDFSQQIAGLSIALSSLRHRLDALPGAGDLPADVMSLQQRTIALAENIRQLSHDLHPTVLEHAGLVAALSAYCADVEGRHHLVVTFTTTGDFASTPPAAALCLYRVAQEGLRNIVVHAEAGHAEVVLERFDDHTQLTIADDGRGFDVAEVNGRGKGRGLGLVSINERVRLAGGTAAIVTELKKGTSLRVQLPTPASRRRQADVKPRRASASAPSSTRMLRQH